MTFINIDVEACGGPTPASGIMTEFGAVELKTGKSFHGILWPSHPSAENPAIPELDEGAEPFDHLSVMQSFENWINQFEDKIVFVSDNNGYDAMWLNYYSDKYLGKVLGGHSSRRIGDFAAGIAAAKGDGSWRNTTWWKKLRVTSHTHNPVDDSMGNIEALRKLIEMVDQSWKD